MKNITLILLTFLLIFPFKTEAQLGSKLRQAAERGVTRAIEKTVENETEKIARRQLEKTFEGLYGDDVSGVPGMDISKILSGISEDVAVADSYSFTGFSTLEITGQDEKGKKMDPMTMKYFLSEDASIMGMEMNELDKKSKDGKAIMIYDMSRNASIILFESEGEKSRMAYGFDFEKIAEGLPENVRESTDEPIEDVKFKRTGNSKTLMGYACEEFVYEDEEGIATYWITKDPIQGKATFWGASNPHLTAKMKNQNAGYFQDMPQGHLMEVNFESRKDKTNMVMKVVELNDSQKQHFEMNDYPNMFAGMQAEK